MNWLTRLFGKKPQLSAEQAHRLAAWRDLPAADLGARPGRVFWSITLPLSLPGVLAGSLFVFVPSVGEFVVPELLGGPGTPMIGKVIWQEFFNNRDWPLASALAVVLLVLLAYPIARAQRAETATARGLS